MLSISTCKNQSTEVRGALNILTYEYDYRVITRCDIILYECYITDMTQMREYKKIYNNEWTVQKETESHNRKILEPIRGSERKDSRWSTNDPRFGCATLISNGDPNTIQDPESGHEGSGESESYPTSM